jgi:regulator of protease activity HflC (stomatin/prohibitin superfamily)
MPRVQLKRCHHLDDSRGTHLDYSHRVLGARLAIPRVMIRLTLALPLVFCTIACSTATVDPGHRALVFAPDRGGLQREVLSPGVYHLHGGERVEDFDVTYARRELPIRATTRDGTPVEADLTVVYRPIISELYSLETDEGPRYFDHVIAPELLGAARGVLERSSKDEDLARTSKLDDSLELAAKRATVGKHVEIEQVVIDKIEVAP